MTFSELNSKVDSTSPWTSPSEPVWQLSFSCPLCKRRTVMANQNMRLIVQFTPVQDQFLEETAVHVGRLLFHGHGEGLLLIGLFHPLNDQAGQVQHRTSQL